MAASARLCFHDIQPTYCPHRKQRGWALLPGEIMAEGGPHHEFHLTHSYFLFLGTMSFFLSSRVAAHLSVCLRGPRERNLEIAFFQRAAKVVVCKGREGGPKSNRCPTVNNPWTCEEGLFGDDRSVASSFVCVRLRACACVTPTSASRILFSPPPILHFQQSSDSIRC